MTISEDGKWIEKAYDLCNGYVLKKSGSDELIKAIERVNSGYSYFEGEVRKILDEQKRIRPELPEGPIRLTDTEIEILKLSSQGFNNADIARIRNCQVGTIETHKTNIYRKLGATNAANAVGIAKDLGLIKTTV